LLYTAGLYRFLEKENLRGLFPRIWATEMELTRILGDAEAQGLPIDAVYLQGLSSRLGAQIDRLRKKWHALVGPQYNHASDNDVRDLVYGVYKIPVGRLTKKAGKASVEAEVLEGLQAKIPVLSILLELRSAEKIKETYCENLLNRLDANSRVHPSFWQVGTNTGRLSCSEPNFQNMPAEDADRAKEHGGVDPLSVRRAFAVTDWPRWFFDYSQIELRVLAAYSRDPIMLDVYAHNGDIHKRTQEEVSARLQRPVERRPAKIVNFGLSYGMAAGGLSRKSGLPMDQAEQFMSAFFERYRGIAIFRERLWAQVRQSPTSSITNMWGRMRRVPQIKSPDRYLRGRAERQAIGSLIQGTAAELTKESLVRVDRLKRAGYPLRIVNTVHDEIQIEIDPAATVETVTAIKTEMERYPELAPVPVLVDAEYATEHWAEKHKIKKE
jgi:DNA polymerase-1